MRVTNSMISNSSQVHIGNAKTELMKRQNQYTTQKKIQRPSDDPTVAIRALQFRTTYSQIQQYADKNVRDAMNWMDTTESAMTQINGILENMKGYLNQGANDDLTVSQRNSVLSVLKEYANAVFTDNANTDYSGRYMFTGYRTDTSLLFPEKTDNLQYEIVEHLDSKDINAISVVYGGAEYADNKTAAQYATEVPKQVKAYCMQLAYDKCAGPSATDNKIAISLTSGRDVTDASGAVIPAGTVTSLNVASVSSTDVNAYNLEEYNTANGTNYDAIFVYDTGEIVLSEDTYGKIQAEESDIAVTYNKEEFEKDDIRPEMYFECTSYNTQSKKTIQYADPDGQDIRYEVNFSQTAVVNAQAKDAISTDIYRMIDYVERMVNEANAVDEKIAEIDKKISNTESSDPKYVDYQKYREMLVTQKSLCKGSMTEAFAMGLTMVDNAQDILNVAIADVGTRSKRMELTYDKLSDQKVDTEEKMSDNEDVDIADAYINLSQADNLYQASLSATAKILGNSLLNYI